MWAWQGGALRTRILRRGFALLHFSAFGCCKTGAPGRTKNANTGIHYARMRKNANDYVACALAQTAPLLSKPCDKAMASFEDGVGPLVHLYLGVFDWKVQRFCWSKGTSLECAESIYVKTTETACVSDELCRFNLKKKKKKKKSDKS